MECSELGLIDWLSQRLPRHERVALGIGDDMATVRTPSGPVLIGSDVLLDGVHCDTARHPLERIGRKAVARCLSDCAAMAARPLAATVSIALPRWMDLESAQRVLDGAVRIAESFETPIAGGDTARWDNPLAIDVTLMAAPYEGLDPVTRSGARPGDRLYVTDVLGGSLRAKHLDFTPRVHEARRLAEVLGSRLHALIDISDGLSLDLWRICRASGCGARLAETLVRKVISPDAEWAAEQDGQSPLDHALGDGEDFELLLAVEGDAAVDGVALFPIGSIQDGPLEIRADNGSTAALEPRGYLH